MKYKAPCKKSLAENTRRVTPKSNTTKKVYVPFENAHRTHPLRALSGIAHGAERPIV